MYLQTLIDTQKLLVMPEDEYHAASGLNVNPYGTRGSYLASHLLGKFRRKPSEFLKLALKDKIWADCYAFRVGRATHSLILEGVANVDRFSTETIRVIREMQNAVKSHPFATQILSAGKAELVARAWMMGYDCQVRLDWLTEYGLDCPPLAPDLKTTKSLDTFADDVLRYGYVDQMAFYSMVLGEVIDVNPADLKMLLIAVEKTANHPRCAVYAIHPDWLSWGRERQTITIAALDFCCTRGIFDDTFPVEYAAQMPEPPNCLPLIEMKAA